MYFLGTPHMKQTLVGPDVPRLKLRKVLPRKSRGAFGPHQASVAVMLPLITTFCCRPRQCRPPVWPLSSPSPVSAPPGWRPCSTPSPQAPGDSVLLSPPCLHRTLLVPALSCGCDAGEVCSSTAASPLLWISAPSFSFMQFLCILQLFEITTSMPQTFPIRI